MCWVVVCVRVAPPSPTRGRRWRLAEQHPVPTTTTIPVPSNRRENVGGGSRQTSTWCPRRLCMYTSCVEEEGGGRGALTFGAQGRYTCRGGCCHQKKGADKESANVNNASPTLAIKRTRDPAPTDRDHPHLPTISWRPDKDGVRKFSPQGAHARPRSHKCDPK